MSDDLTTSISLLSEAATRAENTTTFFDDVTTGGTDETVTNPNNSVTVPTVQKQIYDLYTEDGTTIAAQDAQEAAEAAQEAAEAAQAAAEAAEASTVEISGLDTVYDAIGLVSPANIQWDVEIPFNDSLNIARGYGTYDQIDVSADQDESVMVDLTTKSVDFSRASTTGSFNKSTVFETLDEDEPMICSDGFGVFGSYTNLVTYSEDFSQSDWIKTNVTMESQADNYSSYKLIASTDNLVHRLEVPSISITSGTTYTISILAKKDDLSRLVIQGRSGGFGTTTSILVDLDSGEIVSGTGGTEAENYTISSKDSEGFYCISMSLEATSTTSDRVFWIRPVEDGSDSYTDAYAGDGVSGVFIAKAQVTESSTLLPYIATGSSTVTRSADIATIPMENNFPAAGEDLTVIVDVAGWSSVTSSDYRDIFHRSAGTDGALSLRINTSGYPVFYSRDSDGAFSGSMTGDIIESDEEYRFAITYSKSDSEFSMYQNGVLSDQASSDSAIWPVSDNIAIGSTLTGGESANTYIKGFKVLHECLSADEVSALGSAS